MNDECVQHECAVALLLIDVINDLEFDGGEALAKAALPAAGNIAWLKQEAKKHGVPCLYVNENFGQWQSDFKHLVMRCVQDNVRGAPISRQLAPEPDDYFVLKPRHSGFFSDTSGSSAPALARNEISSLRTDDGFLCLVYGQRRIFARF